MATGILSSAPSRARMTTLSSSFINRTISCADIFSNPYERGLRASVPNRHLLSQPYRPKHRRRLDSFQDKGDIAFTQLRRESFDEDVRSLPETAGKTQPDLFFP